MGKDEQKQSVKISGLAIGSLVSALIIWIIFLCHFYVYPLHSLVFNSSFQLLMAGCSLMFGVSYFCFNHNKRNAKSRACAIGGIILSLLGYTIFPTSSAQPDLNLATLCATHLRGIGASMTLYANDYGDQYPRADKWCDLLLADSYIDDKRMFICLSAFKKGDKGPCHFAINPRCKPDSPPDTVLLFETKGGWNQHGGVELVTTENHGGRCCVLFNDGRGKAVADPAKLNWGTESTDKQ